MKRKPHSRRKRTTTKSVLRLPDLEHAKAAVLNSLTSLDAQRGYRHAESLSWVRGCGRVADNSEVFIGASRRNGKNQLDRRCTFPQQAIKVLRPSTRAREI